MNHDDYVREREERDPAFRAAREELRPVFEFRKALIGARIAAGLTQQELADRMGMKQPQLARLESATNLPSLETLQRLAQALDVDFVVSAEAIITVRKHEAA
jgi:transcriptional regulator with XRE-family HTH domain